MSLSFLCLSASCVSHTSYLSQLPVSLSTACVSHTPCVSQLPVSLTTSCISHHFLCLSHLLTFPASCVSYHFLSLSFLCLSASCVSHTSYLSQLPVSLTPLMSLTTSCVSHHFLCLSHLLTSPASCVSQHFLCLPASCASPLVTGKPMDSSRVSAPASPQHPRQQFLVTSGTHRTHSLCPLAPAPLFPVLSKNFRTVPKCLTTCSTEHSPMMHFEVLKIIEKDQLKISHRCSKPLSEKHILPVTREKKTNRVLAQSLQMWNQYNLLTLFPGYL